MSAERRGSGWNAVSVRAAAARTEGSTSSSTTIPRTAGSSSRRPKRLGELRGGDRAPRDDLGIKLGHDHDRGIDPRHGDPRVSIKGKLVNDLDNPALARVGRQVPRDRLGQIVARRERLGDDLVCAHDAQANPVHGRRGTIGVAKMAADVEGSAGSGSRIRGSAMSPYTSRPGGAS